MRIARASSVVALVALMACSHAPASKPEWKRSDRIKLLVASTVLGTGFTIGARECDAARDCKAVLTANAVLTGLVGVLTLVSFFTE